jgi:hypothetical protein
LFLEAGFRDIGLQTEKPPRFQVADFGRFDLDLVWLVLALVLWFWFWWFWVWGWVLANYQLLSTDFPLLLIYVVISRFPGHIFPTLFIASDNVLEKSAGASRT